MKVSDTKQKPVCKLCGKEMTDVGNQRWYCQEDEIILYAKEDRWSVGKPAKIKTIKCKTCDKKMTLVNPDKQIWYCENDRRAYYGLENRTEENVAEPVIFNPLCKKCNQPMKFANRTNKWYCYGDDLVHYTDDGNHIDEGKSLIATSSLNVAKCKICGKGLSNLGQSEYDTAERRWYCQRDNLMFYETASSWSDGEVVPLMDANDLVDELKKRFRANMEGFCSIKREEVKQMLTEAEDTSKTPTQLYQTLTNQMIKRAPKKWVGFGLVGATTAVAINAVSRSRRDLDTGIPMVGLLTLEQAAIVQRYQPDSTKFCRRCGAKIPRDSTYCEECGTNLS